MRENGLRFTVVRRRRSEDRPLLRPARQPRAGCARSPPARACSTPSPTPAASPCTPAPAAPRASSRSTARRAALAAAARATGAATSCRRSGAAFVAGRRRPVPARERRDVRPARPRSAGTGQAAQGRDRGARAYKDLNLWALRRAAPGALLLHLHLLAARRRGAVPQDRRRRRRRCAPRRCRARAPRPRRRPPGRARPSRGRIPARPAAARRVTRPGAFRDCSPAGRDYTARRSEEERMSKWLAVALALIAVPAVAQPMRCGGRLVESRRHHGAVLEFCGQPAIHANGPR